MTVHSALGPSSSSRWINCPGSVRLTAGLPDTASEHSREGTVAHWLSEQVRREDVSPWKWIDKEVDGVIVTREMCDAVDQFCEYVEESEGEALIEATVRYEEWVPGGFGTLDDARMRPGLAVLTDFKYGKGVQVFAKDNTQLMLYALGVWAEFDWVYNFERFILCIHQPRLDHIDTWSITVGDLLAWADKVLKPAYAATQAAEPPLKPGEWCRWCRIKTTCKARASAVFEDVVGDFEDVTDAVAKPLRGGLTNDEVALILPKLAAIRSWCGDIESHAMKELQQGRAVGDFKVVAGRSSRQWGLEGVSLEKAWARAGLSPDDLYEKKLVTMPQAEKKAGKKHAVWQTEGIVVKSAGKPTLAPGDDPRPALVVDPNAEFEDVEGEQ